MKNNVFVINGMARAGKDTFVKLFDNNSDYDVMNVSTIDPIKDLARTIIKWDGNKTEKSRKLLSDLKKIMTEYDDRCFNYLKENIDKYSDMIYFIHCREIDEIERIVKEFDAKTILIKNNRVQVVESNDSDKNVFNYNYDYVIENNGSIEEFEEKVKKFLKLIDN